jgi:hypothetical protein
LLDDKELIVDKVVLINKDPYCGVSRDTIDEAPLSPPAAPPSPPSFYVSPGFSSAVFEEDDPTVTPRGYTDWISPSSSSFSLLGDKHGEAEGSLEKQSALLQKKLQMKEEMLADISHHHNFLSTQLHYIQSKREALQSEIEHLQKQVIPLGLREETVGNDQPQEWAVTRASARGPYLTRPLHVTS